MTSFLKGLISITCVSLCLLLTVKLTTSQSTTVIPKCTTKKCEKYIEDNGCPDVSNCTGIVLPSPTICNCCKYCLNYIDEGDECSPGVPGQASVQKICGPQLTCGEDNICVKMKTPCMLKRAHYEEQWKNGTLGGSEIDPFCDDLGDYGHIQCIPGSVCFCSSPAGERIFGEMVNKYSDMKSRMDCGCSNDEWRARKRIIRIAPNYLSKTKSSFARCLPSGSYDILQCVRNRCMCVDKKGTPQPPDAGKNVDYTFLSHTGNGKPWCFNLTRYEPGSFDTTCLKKRGEALDLIHQLGGDEKDISSNTIVLGMEYVTPVCDPDGSYSRVQQDWDRKYCVDPDGNEIKGPNGTYSALLNSTYSNDMNCTCARTAFLLNQWNEEIESNEEDGKNQTAKHLPAPLIVNIPQCCPNGNFALWQCRNGVCYCVDGDGAQTSPNVQWEEVNSLPCYNNNDKCPPPQI